MKTPKIEEMNPELRERMIKDPMGSKSALSALLSGISPLAEPDYHKLNAGNLRLLHACLCAYTKHQHDNQHIGWDELGSILHSAICEEIGDEAFVKWNELISETA